MDKDKTVYLRFIEDSFRKISEYIGSMSFEEFSKDQKTQSAVLMQIHIIGEMAKRVPEDMKAQINIPWKDVMGFRDMISHEYFGLDIKLIWETATESVPQAENEVKKYLQSLQA